MAAIAQAAELDQGCWRYTVRLLLRMGVMLVACAEFAGAPTCATLAPGLIFESFFTTKSQGMGMGLSICRLIIRIKSEFHESDGVLVSVEDSEPGIDPNDIERIFNAIFTTKARGTRMGLAICRSIIEAHHGRFGHLPASSTDQCFGSFCRKGAPRSSEAMQTKPHVNWRQPPIPPATATYH
jgi:histidine kinase/DNA gyrase B/HSP90-like ATPase